MNPGLEGFSSTDRPANAWRDLLLPCLQQVSASAGVSQLLLDTLYGRTGCGIHLGVFVEPYLTFILEGKKTIESRFSVNKHAPFEQVQIGDILILKRSSGPVCGLCRISYVWYYRVDPTTWRQIQSHATALCMDASPFWEKKKAASYASLMQIEDVCRIPDLEISKIDPQSWIVLRQAQKQQRLIGL